MYFDLINTALDWLTSLERIAQVIHLFLNAAVHSPWLAYRMQCAIRLNSGHTIHIPSDRGEQPPGRNAGGLHRLPQNRCKAATKPPQNCNFELNRSDDPGSRSIDRSPIAIQRIYNF